MFSNNHFREAGQTLIGATSGLKKIILAEDPGILVELFRVIISIRRRRRDEIALVILPQISALSGVLLDNEHPLRRICAWLASVNVP